MFTSCEKVFKSNCNYNQAVQLKKFKKNCEKNKPCAPGIFTRAQINIKRRLKGSVRFAVNQRTFLDFNALRFVLTFKKVFKVEK